MGREQHLSAKFLGVVWLGRTKVIPEAVTDKVQANCDTAAGVLGLLGYLTVFIQHLAQILKPLYCLVPKGIGWH